MTEDSPDAAAPEPQEASGADESPVGARRAAREERAARRAQREEAAAVRAKRNAEKELKQTPVTRTVKKVQVNGLRLLVIGSAIVIVALVAALVAYFSPAMAVRSTVVVGTGTVSEKEVVAAAEIADGTPLLRVDTAAAAGRVALIRAVASARVQREYPSTIRITIVERVPLAFVTKPDGTHLLDKLAVDYATAPVPPGVPELLVASPVPGNAETAAALSVLSSLAPSVSSQLASIAAPSISSITLTLTDKRQIVWGVDERTQEKADKLAALLTQPGQVYDISSPDLPTIR